MTGMVVDMLQAIIPIVGTIIDRLMPDETKANEMKAELVRMQQQGELDLLKGQIEVNKVEAASGSFFVAGWRPFIGWACGMALAYEYLIMPILAWMCINVGLQAPPHLVMDGMMELILAMLGIAGLRTYEKYKGVSK